MEMFEEELAASGAFGVTEVWLVYVQAPKNKDPRAPGRSVSFAGNNKETVLFSYPPGKTKEKVIHRAEFNTCGEVSTTSTTYTGIPMRRFCELPRMSHETKQGILGAAASGASVIKRLQADIDEKGHPFSWAEMPNSQRRKPSAIWSRWTPTPKTRPRTTPEQPLSAASGASKTRRRTTPEWQWAGLHYEQDPNSMRA